MGIDSETVELNTQFKRKLQLKKAENRCLFRLGCDTVQSGPGSEGNKPGPAGPGIKNIETGLDWKPGWSSPGTRQAAKPAKKTLY
jgi:hypothetical protein